MSLPYMKMVAWRAQNGVSSRSNTVANRSHFEHWGRTSNEIVASSDCVVDGLSVTGSRFPSSAGRDGLMAFPNLGGQEHGGMPSTQREAIGTERECLRSALRAREPIHGEDLVAGGGGMFHICFIGRSCDMPQKGSRRFPSH